MLVVDILLTVLIAVLGYLMWADILYDWKLVNTVKALSKVSSSITVDPSGEIIIPLPVLKLLNNVRVDVVGPNAELVEDGILVKGGSQQTPMLIRITFNGRLSSYTITREVLVLPIIDERTVIYQ